MRTERRRYFRIDDTALIRYCVVAEPDLEAARTHIAHHSLQADKLRAHLEPLDAHLTELTPALRRESRVVADAIELINRKLSLLADVLALDHGAAASIDHREQHLSTVNLSGGGLAMRADAALPAKTWLAIDLVLLPGNYTLRAVGRVTDVRKRGAEYSIGIEFDALREEDRDALISHALRKQAQMLRQERGGQARQD